MSIASTPQERHPEVFTAVEEDPRSRQRTVPMKVLSLGMPRTGTNSMQHALNILGYPCYHGVTLIAHLRDTEMWNEAFDARYFGIGKPFRRDDWDQLLGSYAAVTDLPAIAFAEDLIEAYPEAKVVLIERDLEKWYPSFNEGIIMNVWNPLIPFVARIDTQFMGRMAGTAFRWTKGWMGAHSRREMQEKARGKYKEHYELVEKVTPPGRLLKFDLRDGWRPLCEFLDVPIPAEDFPNVNETAALKEKVALIQRKGFTNVFRKLAKVVLPFLAMFAALKLVGVKSTIQMPKRQGR